MKLVTTGLVLALGFFEALEAGIRCTSIENPIFVDPRMMNPDADGKSFKTAYSKIGSALKLARKYQAQKKSGKITLVLKQGVFDGVSEEVRSSEGYIIDISGVSNLDIIGGFKGDRECMEDMELLSPNRHNTILDGFGSRAVLKAQNLASNIQTNILIKNLIIKRGDSNHFQGGGVRIEGVKNLIFDKVWFFKNEASGSDAGALIVYRSQNIRIQNSRFVENSAKGDAGALWVEAVQNLTIKNNVFWKNSSRMGSGAALTVLHARHIAIIGNTFTENRARKNGGALLIRNSRGRTHIAENKFIANTAQEGGGAYLAETLDPRIESNWFKNNGTENGTAIFIDAASNRAKILRNKFEGNKGNGYGALMIRASSNPVIVSNTFLKNRHLMGGGVYIESVKASLDYNHFISNESYFGNAVLLAGARDAYFLGNTFRNNRASKKSFSKEAYLGRTQPFLCVNIENGDIFGVRAPSRNKKRREQNKMSCVVGIYGGSSIGEAKNNRMLTPEDNSMILWKKKQARKKTKQDKRAVANILAY